MRKALRNAWKRVCSVLLAAAMVVTMIPAGAQAAATSSSANADGTFDNPVIYADVPDIDMIRVGDVYYMVSTTMHLSPGCPIMKSTDLVNWEIVNYVYDILGDTDAMNLRNGQSMYGNGQWAASLKYNDGTYYVAFNSNTTGTAYLYTTKDIEKGSWTKTTLNGFFHDMSLFFDDNGKRYVLYGADGLIRCAELAADLKSVKKDTEQTLFDMKEEWKAENANTILAGEGTHIMKKDGYYYVFNIAWPEGKPRTEVCHRSKTFPSSNWERKVILQANFANNGVNAGVAQGAVIDTPNGKWYGFMFQDHGAIGRTPILTDCTWKDGWPMLGKNGDGQTVEATMQLPVVGSSGKTLVKSDEFYNDAQHREFEAKEVSVSAKTYNDAAKETETEIFELVQNGDFENGTTYWEGLDGGELELVSADNGTGKTDNHVLRVKNRKNSSSSAKYDFTGKIKKGTTYTVKGRMKYDGENVDATKKFVARFQNSPAGAAEPWMHRPEVGTIELNKGEWKAFEFTYTAADRVVGGKTYEFGTGSNYFFIEGLDYADSKTAAAAPGTHLMDYYLDDISITYEAPNENMAGDSSFNKGLGPWAPFEGHARVELVKPGRGGDDDQCLKASEREQNWHGPGIVFNNKMTPGNTYTIKAYVKYDAATPAEQEFYFTMKGTKAGSTEPRYETLATGKVKTGEWALITGEWKMPDDANQDWTMYVNTGSAPAPHMDFYLDDVTITEIVKEKPADLPEAGEHDYNGSNLDLVWQWNHNPNNNNWSLTERDGWLRLKTGNKATSLLNARNTLTQRTFGPVCSGSIRMDISNMQNGDVAGLGSLSFKYGYIAVKKEGNKATLQMVDASANNTDTKEDKPVVKASVDCTSNIVYLKEDFNFAGNADGSDKDTVAFYYSFDGKTWSKLGDSMRMSYELVHFMGSKFAIFNYATVKSGGYVDVDYFKVSDKITGTTQSTDALNATLTATQEVSGVVGGMCEAKLNLDELKAGSHTSLEASINVPDGMSVEEIVFNAAAIKGQASYTVKGSRLLLNVSGNDVSFASTDKLFATIKFKYNSYVDADKNIEIKADYVKVDNGASEYDVTGCIANVKLKAVSTKAIAKKLGYGNPIFTQAFGADPYAMEYDGRVYVYMTADEYEYAPEDNYQLNVDGVMQTFQRGELLPNTFSKINTLRVVSSSDLMNWTDHGEIAVAGPNGAAKWATNSWAPAIAHKTINGKEKFFLYFANGGSGIGVLEGDSPLGPWTDPRGEALLTYGYPECTGVVWCFDPAVLVDDDGTGYIYFGGGVPAGQNLNPKTARVAKLTDDMVHIEGRESKMIDAPCMFEDSGIFKYNDKYYYSYCSNFTPANKDGYPGTGTICYMVSDDPMGPFTYAGEVFSNPSVWFGTPGNNHHATFVFEGESYFIYHAQTVAKEEGKMKGYRSTHIDKIEMRADGTIKPIKGTYEGIPQLHTMNPYERIDAETIAWNAGVKVIPCKEPGKLFSAYNTALTDLQDGDWTSVAQLDFGEDGAVGIKVNAASAKGGKIEVRLDSPEGPLVGTVEVPATGSDETYKLTEAKLEDVSGTRNVFLVFRGTEANIMNVDYYEFVEMPKKDKPEGGSTVQAPKVGEIFTTPDGVKYKVTAYGSNGNSVTVTGTDKTLTSLTIPDTVTYNNVTLTVTAIADSAFENQANLTSVTIGKNVTTIGAKAFMNAKKLKKITFRGTAVKTIGKDAFKNIDKKAAFTMTKTFTSKNLKYKITKSTASAKEVSVTGASKKLTSVKIPATVTFNGMSFKVTSVGKKAFKKQAKLKSATIGKNVKSIGANAFSGDKKLAKIKFSGTAIKSIGKNAFKGIRKNAKFSVKKSKKAAYKKLLKKAKTKAFVVK